MSVPAWLVTTSWGLLCSLVCAGLMAFHLAALPAPALADAALQGALARHSDDGERGRWRMVHVLYQRCACSRRIIDHLVAGARPQDMAERVVLVDAAADTVNELVAAGFHVDQVSAEALHADWHIDAAPLLLVVDPAGTVRYAGGYTARKQGPVIADLDIVGRVRAGSAAESLPLFGCAVSRALQSSVDPLGLKRLLAWRPLSS